MTRNHLSGVIFINTSRPDGFKIVCDSAFARKGALEGKIVKLKDDVTCYEDKTERERQLTHLRQCSEWGNQNLAGAF